MKRPISTLALFLALGLLHCKKTPEPTGSGGPSLLTAGKSETTPAPVVAPSALPVGVTWVAPEGWPQDPKPQPMRKATYKVPKAAGDLQDGELAISYFGPGQGGALQANVDRWAGQFSDRKPAEPRQADRTVNGLVQHTIEIDEGTFNSGMPGGAPQPKGSYGLLGAIVDAPTGTYFFKLTGPKATVQASREQFYKFLDSIKPNS